MNRASRFGSALSALAVAAVLSGCAAGQQSRSSIFGSQVDHQNIGLATRAQAALNEGQVGTAVQLAERAVENTPNDAGFRALLGNIYFAAGRFASAEAAYVDSLSLIPGQGDVILKLALVQIAQGKTGEAQSALAAGQALLDPANLGLALALAGRPHDAVALLNEAARMPGADGRVRQNLALAHGLAGDWTMARTIAAQDVPPAQLDSRIQQWMAMAVPSRPSDQVAALTGVTPAADPGMPQQLALNRAPRPSQAEAYAYVAAPAVPPQPQPEPVRVEKAPVPPPAIAVAVAPVMLHSAPPAPEAPAIVEADPAVEQAVQTLIEPVVQPASLPAADAPVEFEAPVIAAAAPAIPRLPASFEAAAGPEPYVAISETVRRAAESARKARASSNAVVQLGAYSSPDRVSVAWERLTSKYPALRDYTPVRARFESAKGTVWRLSIKGFASQSEAIERCERLQRRGGACFVRTVAGDKPVQLASR